MTRQSIARTYCALRPFLPPLLVLALTAAAYTATLAPGILGGDAGELQFVPSILSLTHPTGYPLQTLLNRLWVAVVPFGSVAWRTNLLSALAAAGGVALLWFLVRRVSDSWLAATAAALLLAVSPVYWGQAVLGDKYALNALLTALVLTAAYSFYRAPNRAGSWLWLGLAAGASLAHHRSFLAFGPALAALVLIRGGRAPLKSWLAVGAGLALPLLLYLYVPWASHRGLPPYQAPIYTLSGFARFMQDAGYLGQVKLAPQAANLASYWTTLRENFAWPALLIGVTGVALALIQRRDPGWLVFLLACFLLQAYLTQNYMVPRQFVFYIPAYVCLVALIGSGLSHDATQPPGNRKPWLSVALVASALVIAALALARLPAQWQQQRRSQSVETPLDIFRQDLKSGGAADRLAASLRLAPPRALISADWEQATPLWYAQQVDQLCPDCLIRSQMENELQQHSERAAAEDRPFMVARTVNGAGNWSFPTARGALVALERQPSRTAPAGLSPVNATYDGRIRLAGYHWPLGQPQFARGKVLPLSLVWQSLAAAPHYSLSLRLQRGDAAVWTLDTAAPVLGMMPFSKLAPGQVIEDYYEVPIAPDAPAGRYTLAAILYLSADGTFANAEAVGPDGVSLGPAVTVLTFDLP